MLTIPIVLGTAHKGRQTEKAARYVLEQLKKVADVETELLDVRDYHPTATDNSEKIEPALRWKEKVVAADGFVIVAPEYNHGYSGELKMTLDLIYGEYEKKPVAICGVSNGNWGGARMVEQLRLVLIALHMVPTGRAVYFRNVPELFDEQGKITDVSYDKQVAGLFEELLWYARALKAAREEE